MDDNRDQFRGGRGSSQKTMLSRALQKANTAVLLDNATNYEGAIEAYTDACELLSQVMHRAGGDGEKHKLGDIRNTYTTRINELRRLGLASRTDGKALPERPVSEHSISRSVISPHPVTDDDDDDDQDVYVIGTATATRVVAKPPHATKANESQSLAPSQIPPRRQSLLPSSLDGDTQLLKTLADVGQSGHSRAYSNQGSTGTGRSFDATGPASENDDHQLPTHKPLSPLLSLEKQPDLSIHSHQTLTETHSDPQRPQDTSNETTSWLDTIDESGASSNSSMRSRSSSIFIQKKHGRDRSGGTEAEFDAALDAAVEAAYDGNLEATKSKDSAPGDDVMSNVRRNIELAKQRVREAEMEAEAASAKEREKRRIQEEALLGDFSALDPNYEDHEAEEEERILEEMMDDFEFDLQSKSALPRQSGSSGFSGRTWGSSVTSNRTNPGISLSTLAEEDDPLTYNSKLSNAPMAPPHHPPPQPPPTCAPPPPPVPGSAPTDALPLLPSQSKKGDTSAPSPETVRTRRLSGRNPKELIIETGGELSQQEEGGPHTVPPSMPPSHPTSSICQDEPKTSIPPAMKTSESEPEITTYRAQPTKSEVDSIQPSSVDSPMTAYFPTPSYELGKPLPSPSNVLSRLSSAPTSLQKDITTPHTRAPGIRPGSRHGLDSPSTSGFLSELGKAHSLPNIPTISGNNNPLHIFDNHIHSLTTPGSPNTSALNPPLPLEPCPQSFLLRPFWLMRSLYETIAHPRGGYLTSKLFIPRDVWRVKNVKIKGLEEKISNCDLLTAALLKLSKVDTTDADAVLEEMQSFENVLDQVQTLWARKLGHEVGVQSGMALFKLSTPDETSPSNDPFASKYSSGGGKSYLTSWRKLRSKSSGANTSNSGFTQKDGNKETLSMNSLPMTDALGFRVTKRDVTQLDFIGPNSNYMSALARLFDAAQVIDQIAHQVEDPGLKHTSQTLVGLELSTRHAAEFFGFYVCRFALNDIGLMTDKFIKRGSEYALA